MPTEAPSFEFDIATAVRPPSGTDAATFTMEVDPGWTVGPKPNGGYLLAAIARAAGDALVAAGSGHLDPVAATAHYLAAPDPGPADIHVTVLRVGRSASQVRATLLQDGQACVDAAFTMATLPTDPEPPWWSGLSPLKLPPIDACTLLPAAREGAPFRVSIMDRCHLWMDPAVLGFAAGNPSGKAELRGWAAFADERPVDPLGLLFFLDSFPPATFELATTGWVPTLSLSAYVRARPAPGPLRIRQAAQAVDGGRFDEVCEIWDSSNRLVAQATQLAGIRIPEGLTAPG